MWQHIYIDGGENKTARSQAKFRFIWSLITREGMGYDVLEDGDVGMGWDDSILQDFMIGKPRAEAENDWLQASLIDH